MTSIHRGASKLVISIDVGATSSAVAWQHLQRDSIILPPTNVMHWTGAHSDHDVKVPTSILYRGQEPIKFGLAAEDNEDLEGTVLIRNPKLALHPKWLQDLASAPLPPLIPGGDPISTFDKPTIPPHLPIEKIYKDFLTYLIEHTKRSFVVSNLNGVKLFEDLLPSVHWLLGAPNTWSPVEKQFLIDALASTEYCHNKQNVQVISEAEASLLWLIHTSPQSVPLTKDALLTVCDAGGSTIDITLYRCIDSVAMKFIEVNAPVCVQKGAYYVSKALEAYMHSIFDQSLDFSADARSNAKNATADFDSGVKQKWDGTQTDEERFRFSRLFGDNEPTSGIRGGKIALPADYVNKAFDTCVPHVVDALRQRVQDSQGVKTDAILLVGGFGDSPYLQRVLKEQFEDSGPRIPLLMPSINAPGVKAVSAGGVYIITHRDSGVTARAALFSYGVCVNVPYDVNNLEHRGRRVVKMQDGERYVLGAFARLINKNETTTSDEFRSSVRFTYEAENEIAVRTVSISMFMYAGEDLPNFMHERNGKWKEDFYKVGTISGRGLRIPIKRIKKEDGSTVYESDFKIGVSFGGLDIRARIERADGSDFGQEITFRANVLNRTKQEPRTDFVYRPEMRRHVRCAA